MDFPGSNAPTVINANQLQPAERTNGTADLHLATPTKLQKRQSWQRAENNNNNENVLNVTVMQLSHCSASVIVAFRFTGRYYFCPSELTGLIRPGWFGITFS